MHQYLAYENQFEVWQPYHWVMADNTTIRAEYIPEGNDKPPAVYAVIVTTHALKTLQKGETL